jgi:hypothetical protein
MMLDKRNRAVGEEFPPLASASYGVLTIYDGRTTLKAKYAGLIE